MNFLYRINHPKNEIGNNLFPFRGYVLNLGFEETYQDIEGVLEHFNQIMNISGPVWGGRFDFAYGVFWGDLSPDIVGKPSKMLDLYTYSLSLDSLDLPDGPGNPSTSVFVLRNGIWQCSRPILCESSMIMLGKEGEHRRSCHNLEESMRTWPSLGEIEPKTTIRLS